MSQEISEKVHVLIIGSGPAGYTAAIYAARANMKPVLYQGIQPGGQLTITTEVENYPGYPDGIQGPEMMVHFEAQAKRMGADIRYGMASKVDFSKRPFLVEIDEEKWIAADSVIISTGASAKWLGLESEQRLNGFGVSACAVCDGFFYKGQDVAIVGAGDTACEEATYLSKICTKVYMIVRKSEFRASKAMQNRVLNTPNIEVLFNTETELPMSVELPDKVVSKVTYSEPGLRGDTATRTLKPATVETGIEVAVPLFIKQDEKILVDTRNGAYLGRA